MRRLQKPHAVVALAMVLLAALLSGELSAAGPFSNDIALHVSLARGIELNRSLDFWHTTDLGYPTLRLYQPLYHLALAVVDSLTLGAIGLGWWAQLSILALAVALPLGLFFGAREWLVLERLPPAEAAWTAAAVSLLGVLATSFTGFGYDPMQSSSIRFGVITQTWSMVFFAPAFAASFGFLAGRSERPWRGLTYCLLSCGFSLIVGFMLVLSVALRVAIAMIADKQARSLERPLLFAAGFTLVTAFLWLPLMVDVPWVYYPADLFASWVNQGFGQSVAIKTLFTGRLLDGRSLDQLARVPVMSLSFAVAAVVLARDRQKTASLRWFLLGGWALWFSFFIGREFWGSLLYVLPLVRSYQWGRMEALLQFWATVVVALGVVASARWVSHLVSSRYRQRGRLALAAVLVIAGLLLLRAPYDYARNAYAHQRAIRGGQVRAHLERIRSRLRDSSTRLAVGGPTTWEARMKDGQIWLGVALAGEGVPAVGRIYQGMNIASSLMYAWDGRSAWGAKLLGVGNWLAPCDMTADLPLLLQPVEVAPQICLGLAREPAPLAFFSQLAASRRRSIAEGSISPLQRQLVERANAERDVFLPFELAVSSEPTVWPATLEPLAPVLMTGSRFVRTAAGIHQSTVVLTAPGNGAVVFPVSFHPGLDATVDGEKAEPFAVLPGYAAVVVSPGRHEVRLRYRTSHVRDLLFLVAVAALLVGPLVTARIGIGRAAKPL